MNQAPPRYKGGYYSNYDGTADLSDTPSRTGTFDIQDDSNMGDVSGRDDAIPTTQKMKSKKDNGELFEQEPTPKSNNKKGRKK
jgi:hypothetical protein